VEKCVFLALEGKKGDFKSAYGNGKAIQASCMGWGKFFYNTCLVMCEVRGVSAMAKINYNYQKKSDGDSTGSVSY
jgi:hypothetical protein